MVDRGRNVQLQTRGRMAIRRAFRHFYSINNLEVHALYHAPDKAAIIAEHVMAEIKEEISNDPSRLVGVYDILIFFQDFSVLFSFLFSLTDLQISM